MAVDPTKMAAPAVNGGAKPANAAPVDAKSYVLGPEDMIFITVWRSAEFSGQHMIRPDGKITINLVGEVQAAGITPEALGSSIRERLRRVLVDPDVSVSVTQVNSKRYFIEGEVLKPGEYKLWCRPGFWRRWSTRAVLKISPSRQIYESCAAGQCCISITRAP